MEIIELIGIKQGDPATNPDAIIFVNSNNRDNLTGEYTIALSIPSNDQIDPVDGSIDTLADAVFL